jgi:phage terminase large subunit
MYRWKEDKEGRSVNEPIDAFNHALDALRYGVFSPLRVNALGTPRSRKYRLPEYQ